MRLSTDGLIIKENNTGEYDRLVVVLTRDRGLIRAFVPGARRLKNRNASSTGLLCYSRITFFKNRDTYKIDEAAPIEVFFKLRSDIEKLSLAQYFCEMALVLAPEEDDADEYLRLLLNSLHFLVSGERESDLIKSITELRLLSISGYMPNLIACDGCGIYEHDSMFFDFNSAKIYCNDCKPKDCSLIMLSRSVLASMRHIVYSDFNKLFNFTINKETMLMLSAVTERYLLFQTERQYNTLIFYKSLK